LRKTHGSNPRAYPDEKVEKVTVAVNHCPASLAKRSQVSRNALSRSGTG
jgi:hypothetical protein